MFSIIRHVLLLLVFTEAMVSAGKYVYVPTPVDIWAVCDTSHRCAHAEDAVSDSGGWESVVDPTADGGSYLSMKSGTRDYQSQIAVGAVDTTCDYLWLRAKGSGVVWLQKTPFGPVPSNTTASILFNGVVTPDWTWTRIGNRTDENLHRVNDGSAVPVNDVAHRDFDFTTGQNLYVLAQPSVKLDSWFCSTNPSATPVSPGGNPGVTISYALYEVATEPSIDDVAWDSANTVSKSGFSSGPPAADMIIKAVWKNGTPDRLCIRGEETLLNLTWTDVTEDSTTIANYTAVLAYLKMDSLNRVLTANSYVLGVSPQPDHYDGTWPSGVFSTTTDLSNVALSQSASGNRRRMQACVDAPTAISTASQWLCEFRQNERVTGGALRYQQAFNPTSTFDITKWGVCEAGPLLPVVVDTTPPVVGAVTFSNVTVTSFTVSASAVDAESGISACHVVYDTTNNNEVTFGTDPSVVGTMSGGVCSATVSGLIGNTAYEAAIYAVNGTGLTTTGPVGDQTTLNDTSSQRFVCATGGNNGSSGTSVGTCWADLQFATNKAQLLPGYTLTLANGTYTSLFPNLNCLTSGNANNGTTSAPITIRAENERQAWLKGDGTSTVFKMSNCHDWNIIGLRFSGRDNNVSPGKDLPMMQLISSDHILVQRGLFHHSNRYGNNPLLMNGGVATEGSSFNTFIENEFYYFHRSALVSKYGHHNVTRRNFCHSRDYVDLTGYASNYAMEGDACIQNYPSSNNLHENNIAQSSGPTYTAEPVEDNVDNQFLGNIAYDTRFGALLPGRDSTGKMNIDTVFKDHLIVNPRILGFYSRSTRNTQCTQCSIIGGPKGFIADKFANVGTPPRSIFLTNTLVHTTTTTAYLVDLTSVEAWGINYGAAINTTGVTFSPLPPDPHITNSFTDSSNQMGSCRVWVPTTAPLLKDTGLNGEDIGATVLFALLDGNITQTKLWDTVNGGKWLGAGATINGTNPSFSSTLAVTNADINTVGGGNSAADVHVRLNIMSPGCRPVGY